MAEVTTQKIRSGYILPSAAYTITRNRIHNYIVSDRPPTAGDVLYGVVEYIGQHDSLENKEGRIHAIQDGTRSLFVLGNRYATDYYEGRVPESLPRRLDLLARSGVVGEVRHKSSRIKDPTRVRVLGYVCDASGEVLNTKSFSRILPKRTSKSRNRAKLVLVVGTAMNAGKSMAAAACCWALSSMGHSVRGCKVTGTASLKDILLMEDNGASPVADFTFLGYPTTYLEDESDVLRIFNTLDLKYANNAKNYWVVEIADGILQRETAMLLRSEDVVNRVHRLVFCAADSFGAIGGLKILNDEFALVPDAISGVCSSSPLGVKELSRYCELPIFNSVDRDLNQLAEILV